MKKEMEIPFGRQTITFRLPRQNQVAILQSPEIYLEVDEEEEIRKALREPIGSVRLSHLASRAKNAAIVVSDITRPCPSFKFLPFLLEELEQGGVDPRNITIIFGLGIHRGHSPQEQRNLVGEEVFQKVKLLDFDETDCIFLGQTSRGTPIEIYRPFMESDLKICTGNIEYHYFAGYSGGAKAIMPGISSRRSVEHNHSMMLSPLARAGVVRANPVREDIEEVGKRVGVNFIYNVILNDDKEIIRAVAGGCSAAFEKGIESYDRIFKLTVDEPADIVVTSPGGYPKDINLYQAQKALENVREVVKEGGAIVLVASCEEGMGESTFEKWMLEMPSSPDVLVERIRRKFVLGGHKAAAIASLLKKVDIYLVSSLSAGFVERMGLRPARSVEEALAKAFQKIGSEAKVLVAPHGRVVRLSS